MLKYVAVEIAVRSHFMIYTDHRDIAILRYSDLWEEGIRPIVLLWMPLFIGAVLVTMHSCHVGCHRLDSYGRTPSERNIQLHWLSLVNIVDGRIRVSHQRCSLMPLYSSWVLENAFLINGLGNYKQTRLFICNMVNWDWMFDWILG